MRAKRWVPAGAAVLLVLGVLAARGGTAAGEDDLRPPVAGPSPSPVSEGSPPVVLEANGVSGLRLGSVPRLPSAFSDLSRLQDVDGDGRSTAADLPGGCEPTFREGGEEERGFSTSGWVVDGVVSSVQLTSWEQPGGVLPGVETWLGPTLGSPVESVSELPGARTVTEHPHGTSGPAVTVVRVPLGGVELVASDAQYDMTSLPEDLSGRITTIEVRHPRARACSQEALDAVGPALWGYPQSPGLDLELGLDGITAFPLGTPVQVLDENPGLTRELSQDACAAYSGTTADGGWVRLVALDGAVAQAEAWGPVPSAMGLPNHGSEADVRAALPQTWEKYPQALPSRVEVAVGERVVVVDLHPGVAYVPDVDVPVQGGPSLVQGVSVRHAGAEPARLC